MCSEEKIMEHSDYMGCHHSTPPFRAHGKGGGKIVRIRREGRLQKDETVSFRHNRIDAHMNAETETCTGPVYVHARHGPIAEREKWTQVPIPNQKVICN